MNIYAFIQMSEECTICYNSSDIVTLECDHEFCINCLREYINVKIDDIGIDILCPNEECNLNISREKIIDIICNNEKLLEKYNECEEKQKKIRAIVCLECNKICKKEKENNYIYCYNCDNEFCHVCKERHDDDEYDDCANKHKIDDEFSDLCSVLSDLELKKCPVCKIVIEKIEGCNSVRCKYCRIKFCWNCLALCSDIKKMRNHECDNYDGYIETLSDDEYISGDDL